MIRCDNFHIKIKILISTLKKCYEDFEECEIHILNKLFNQKNDFLQKNLAFELYSHCLH